MLLPYPERLAQHGHRPGHTHPTDEGHTPLGQRQALRRHHETGRQFLQPQAPPVLRRGQTSQPRMDVLGVDRLLQPCQLPPQVTRPTEVALEQWLLKPAVEVLNAAVELRLSFRDEHRADAVAQAQPDHPTQRARRRSPASQFAGVVELDLFGPTQILPAFAEEPEHLVHATRVGQTQADGTVEGILAHPDVVAVRVALEVDRPHEIDLVEFVGGPRLGSGPLLTWQQRSQADSRCGQAVAFQDTFDGPHARKGAGAQSLEFGEDGWSPDQAVTRRRRGVSLEPAANREDGSLQFGRNPLGEVAGSSQVVRPFGARLQVAAPPLVEPDFGAAERSANGLDGSASEAQGNSALTSCEFVVHGYLRVAAAGGCPRRECYAGDGTRTSSRRPWRTTPVA